MTNIMSADSSAATPTLPRTSYADVTDVEIFAYFGLPAREPVRGWERDGTQMRYWGALDSRNRLHGHGLLQQNPRDTQGKPDIFCYGIFHRGLVVHAFRWWTASGSIYRGGVLQQMRHGFGQLLGAHGGLVYEGSFRRNKFDGLGAQRRPDGETYLGWFQAGKRHGPGMWWTRDGSRVIGTHQQGTARPPLRANLSGQRGIWKGELKDGSPAGQGQLLRGEEVLEGDAKDLVPAHENHPAPRVTIIDAAGEAHFTDSPKHFVGRIPALAAFRRALVGGEHQRALAIVAQWKSLPKGPLRRMMHARAERGWTALHFAVRFSGNDQIVRALIALGADVDAHTDDGAQALHIACGSSPAMESAVQKMLGDPTFAAHYMGRPADGSQADARQAMLRYRADARLDGSHDKVSVLLQAGADPQQSKVLVFGSEVLPPAMALTSVVTMHLSAFEMAHISGLEDVTDLMVKWHAALRANQKLLATGARLASITR